MTDDSIQPTTRRRIIKTIGIGSTVGLAGCTDGNGGGSGNEGNGTGTNGGSQGGTANLKWSHWEPVGDSPENPEAAQQFSKKHENIDVEYVVPYPGEPAQGYHQQVMTQVSSGEAADVMTLQPEATYPPLASGGYLENLTPMIKDDDEISLDSYYETYIENLYRWDDGNIYALPCQMSSIAFYYDEDIWANAGVADVPDEWTWEEFRQTLQTLSDNGVKHPFLIPFTQSITKPFYQFMWQNGGNVVNEDRDECIVASDASIEALEFIVTLLDDGLASTVSDVDSPDYPTGMTSRTAASTNGGPWVLRAAQREGTAEGIATTTLPKPSGGNQACVANSHAVSVNAGTENTAEAFEFLKYLANGQYVEERLTLNRGLSPLVEHQDHEHIQSTPELEAHVKMLEYGQPFFFGEGTSEMVQRIVPQLQAAFTGNKSPRAALETAQTKINNEVLNS